jgi:hypothetical protein
MTRTARLFRIVWRINAVVILVAGLLLCVAAIAVLVAIAGESMHGRTLRDTARTGPEVLKGDVFELGSMSRLRGTPVMLLELTSRQRYASGVIERFVDKMRRHSQGSGQQS